MFKLTFSLLLAICLVACASGPSTISSSKTKPTYVGERNEAGEPHGRGVMTWKGGEKYEGNFTNGVREGEGVLTQNGLTYTGSFKDNDKHGFGTEVAKGGTYAGSWKHGFKHGEGKYTYADRGVYEGEWFKGLRHGHGEMRWSDGRTYIGKWNFNSTRGQGKLINTNGDIISGEFSTIGDCGRASYADKESVYCKLEKSNGDVIEGSFYRNRPDGQGTYRHSNGDVYSGYFYAGKRHGRGSLTSAEGDVVSGIWKNGISPTEIQAVKRAEEIKRKEAAEAELAKRVEDRLTACDSFGFERGTDSHAECAMQLYINEQNQANASQVTEQQRKEQQAVLDQQQREQEALLARQRQQLARQEAIQEAILKEQQRVRRMEQSMKLIELGTGIATGSLGGRPTSKMQSHTYTINGQIINCTTTGSSTDCR